MKKIINPDKKTKRRQGRKGESSVAQMMVALIIMLAIVGVAYMFLNKNTKTVQMVVQNNIEALKNDHDGDRLNDMIDASPCVAGQEKVIATDGKEYDYFADAVGKGNDGCDQSKFADLIGTDTKLESKTELGTKKMVCIMPNDVCALALEKDYEKMRERANS